MALPFTSLNAATTTGPGSSKDFEDVSGNHTMIVTTTGSPSEVVVRLQGSHNGSVWVDLGSVDAFGSAPGIVAAAYLVRHVRANISTLTGGSAPTVTATIASDEED